GDEAGAESMWGLTNGSAGITPEMLESNEEFPFTGYDLKGRGGGGSTAVTQCLSSRNERKVEPGLQSGLRGADGGDGIDHPHGAGDTAVDVVVVAGEPDLQIATHRGHALDRHAVGARADAVRPVRGYVIAQAGDVLDGDHRPAGDDARHFEAQRRDGAAFDAPARNLERLLRDLLLVVLANLGEREAERGGDQGRG